MSALLDYDTGPLNWVRGDIDAALQAALGRIQAYSVDADLINALKLARDDAHQATGALRMVGLEGAATLAGTKAGQEIVLEVLRKGSRQTVDVALGAVAPTPLVVPGAARAVEGIQQGAPSVLVDLVRGRLEEITAAHDEKKLTSAQCSELRRFISTREGQIGAR